MPLSSFHPIRFSPASIPTISRPEKISLPKERRRRRRRHSSIQQRQSGEKRTPNPGEEPMPQPQEADDDFTFPTPPPLQLLNGRHNRVSPSSSPPAWLLSSPIRRSFSAADCAASPWRATRGACCSPALSDYAGVFDEEEEELMDSLWEDLNDDEAPAGGKNDLFVASLDVSRRRSVGGPGHSVERRRPTTDTTKEHEAAAAVLAASRSSRRRSPGLVVMMRALKKMFVAHKSRSRVHKVDDQSTASASSSGNSFKK